MIQVLILLAIQGALGAFDNLWHHEIKETLPSRPEAARELALHTVREFLYGIIFLTIGWLVWGGAWAAVLACLLLIEIAVTLADFVVEDVTRHLPPLERVTHSILAINIGAILALWIPELLHWTTLETAFFPAEYGVLSWIMTAYGIGVMLWSVRDAVATWRLLRPEWQRNPILAGDSANPEIVLVTGATGFIGRALTRTLIEEGHRIIVLTRNPHKATHLFGRHVRVVDDLLQIDTSERIDTIINLAGAPVMGGWWTLRRRRVLADSRTNLTAAIVALIARLESKPRLLISGSAVGYYGARGDEVVTEADGPQSIFMSRMCQDWENTARQAECYGVRVCLLRTGLVLGRDGGALPPLLLSTRLFAGMVLGNGRQWMPWILKADLARLIVFIMRTPEIDGPVNATAPYPVRNCQFMDEVAFSLRRRIWLRMPSRVLRRGMGEMADLLLTGQRAIPEKAVSHGFRFAAPTIRRALARLRRDRRKVDWPSFGRAALDVWFNDTCPVCRAEIGHYEKLSGQCNAEIRFRRLSADPAALARFGLNSADAARRLYLVDNDGRLWGGVDAIAALWAKLPGYGFLAKLLRTRLGHALGEVLYDGIAAPLLTAWNRRRARRGEGGLAG